MVSYTRVKKTNKRGDIMSSKKRSKKRLEQRKIELQRLKELEQKLEEQITKIKEENKEKSKIKNLKIFKKTCNYITQYVLIGGLTFGVFKTFGGGTPFITDTIKHYNYHTLEYQTDALITQESKYISNFKYHSMPNQNNLKLYTPWQKTEENLYTRNIQIYDITTLENLKLFDVVLDENIEYIEKNYETKEEQTEITNQIKTENNLPIIKAELNFLDENDFITTQESPYKNVIITISEIAITLGLGTILHRIRNFNYKHEINKIKKEYQTIPLEPLLEKQKDTKTKIMHLTKGGNRYEN